MTDVKLLTSEDCTNFRGLYPEGKLAIVNKRIVPVNAMSFFENYSKRFLLPNEYKRGNFHQLFLVERDERGLTHLAYQTKTYTGTSKEKERLVYLYETNEENQCLGYGEIRFNPLSQKDFFRGKPFVGYTDTPKELRGNGHGTDRLNLMNAMSMLLFDLPLHSDEIQNEEVKLGEGPWRRNLSLGRVERYQSREGRHRYCFKAS